MRGIPENSDTGYCEHVRESRQRKPPGYKEKDLYDNRRQLAGLSQARDIHSEHP